MSRREALHHHRPSVGPDSRRLVVLPFAQPTAFTAGCGLVRRSVSSPGTTGSVFGAGLRLSPTRGVAPLLPRHGATRGSPVLVRGRRWLVVAWKNQREYDGGWGIPGPNFGRSGADQAPSFLGELHDTAGGVRGFSCLQVHVDSAFSRGVQRNIDDSRGTAVISSLSRRRRARQVSSFLGSPPWITSGSFCVLGFEFTPWVAPDLFCVLGSAFSLWVVPGAFCVLRSSCFSLGS